MKKIAVAPLVSLMVCLFMYLSIVAQTVEKAVPDNYFGNGWGVAAKISTLGAGLEIAKNLNDHITVRGGGGFLPFDYQVDEIFGQAAYVNNQFRFSTASLVMDWYPSNNPKRDFHFILGGFYNWSSLAIRARPIQDNYLIGDYKVSSDRIGFVDIKMTPKSINPYMGIGTGRLVDKNKRIGATLELGCVYIGSPGVKMEAAGLVAPTAEQEAIIRGNLNDYRFYPYLSIQLSFILSK